MTSEKVLAGFSADTYKEDVVLAIALRETNNDVS
jgi:hypothetical protein